MDVAGCSGHPPPQPEPEPESDTRHEPLHGHPVYELVGSVSLNGQGPRTGPFSQVARSRENGGLVQVKFVPRGWDQATSEAYERGAVNHMELSMSCHPHIVEFKAAFLTPHYLAVVTEYVEGETIETFLEKIGGKVIEGLARFLAQQLIIAVDYSHRCHKVLRDIRLNNTLLVIVEGQLPILKLGDFASSRDLRRDTGPPPQTGAVLFAAPEVLQNLNGGMYDPRAGDVWAIGVILYVMLFGRHPFLRDQDAALTQEQRMLAVLQRTVRGDAEYPSDVASGLSPACMDVLRRMLQPDPDQRITTQHMLAHPWVLEALPEGAISMNGVFLSHCRGLAAVELEQFRSMVHKASLDDGDCNVPTLLPSSNSSLHGAPLPPQHTASLDGVQGQGPQEPPVSGSTLSGGGMGAGMGAVGAGLGAVAGRQVLTDSSNALHSGTPSSSRDSATTMPPASPNLDATPFPVSAASTHQGWAEPSPTASASLIYDTHAGMAAASPPLSAPLAAGGFYPHTSTVPFLAPVSAPVGSATGTGVLQRAPPPVSAPTVGAQGNGPHPHQFQPQFHEHAHGHIGPGSGGVSDAHQTNGTVVTAAGTPPNSAQSAQQQYMLQQTQQPLLLLPQQQGLPAAGGAGPHEAHTRARTQLQLGPLNTTDSGLMHLDDSIMRIPSAKLLLAATEDIYQRMQPVLDGLLSPVAPRSHSELERDLLASSSFLREFAHAKLMGVVGSEGSGSDTASLAIVMADRAGLNNAFSYDSSIDLNACAMSEDFDWKEYNEIFSQPDGNQGAAGQGGSQGQADVRPSGAAATLAAGVTGGSGDGAAGVAGTAGLHAAAAMFSAGPGGEGPDGLRRPSSLVSPQQSSWARICHGVKAHGTHAAAAASAAVSAVWDDGLTVHGAGGNTVASTGNSPAGPPELHSTGLAGSPGGSGKVGGSHARGSAVVVADASGAAARAGVSKGRAALQHGPLFHLCKEMSATLTDAASDAAAYVQSRLGRLAS